MYYKDMILAQVEETKTALKDSKDISESTILILKNQEVIMKVLSKFLIE